MTHKVTVYDIFLCRQAYLNNIHTRVALRNVKCHPKYNLVVTVVSYQV